MTKITVDTTLRPAMRVSGNRNDIDFWRLRSKVPPIVILDGRVCRQNIVEARSGHCGYVRVEVVNGKGMPEAANVVLPTGEIIDRVIAHRTIYGTVNIIWPEAIK